MFCCCRCRRCAAYLHTQHLHTDGNDLCGHGDCHAGARSASSSLCCCSGATCKARLVHSCDFRLVACRNEKTVALVPSFPFVQSLFCFVCFFLLFFLVDSTTFSSYYSRGFIEEGVVALLPRVMNERCGRNLIPDSSHLSALPAASALETNGRLICLPKFTIQIVSPANKINK